MSQAASQAKPQPSTANKPGRPPFLTDVKRAEICAVVAAGCSFRTAAKYVGCRVQSISALAERDRVFAAQLDRAVATREIIPLSHIREASKHSWRAAAWLLEKTVGGRYGGDVRTLEEEVEAEKSEDVTAFIVGTQRKCAEEFEEQFGPVERAREGEEAKVNAPAVETPAAEEPAAEPIVNTAEIEEQSPSDEFSDSMIDEFLRGDFAAEEARQRADLLASLSGEAEPGAKLAQAEASMKTPDTASPKGLKPGVVLSESISPQSILESMQALEASWKQRGMEA